MPTKNLVLALRRLRSTPSFSLLAVSTLALGLGALTVALTLVESVLLRPLPYSDPSALVRVLAFDRGEGQVEWLSWAEATGLHEQSRMLEDVAVSTTFSATMRTPGEDGFERIERAFVSFNYFTVLGVEPLIGGLFLDGNEQQALISRSLWRRSFAARTDVVGHSVELNGELYTIAGVLPETVYAHDLGSAPPDVWLPESLERTTGDPHFRIYTVVARARPGATPEAIASELGTLQRQLASDEPAVYEGWDAWVEPLQASVVGDTEHGLLLLFAAGAVVLLVVCINLANLMISRFLGRRREIATRLALGDSATGILRDAAIEGGVLATVGGVVGVMLAGAALRLLPHLVPFALPRQSEIALDGTILAASIGFVAGATLLFAVLPALAIARSDFSALLATAGRTVSSGGRLRTIVIGAQVALSVPLLVGAGLLTESLLDLSARQLGMRPDGLVSVRVSAPPSLYRERTDRVRLFQELLREVRTIPGVEQAGATLQVPFVAEQADRSRFRIVEAPEVPIEERPRALLQVVTEGYFESLGTRLVDGRTFAAIDGIGGAPVAIVNRELARRVAPERSVVGLHVETEMTMTPDEPNVRRIVGVVEDIPHFGPQAGNEPQVFVPHTQSAFASMGLVVRARLDEASLVSQIRTVVRDVEPSAAVDGVTTLRGALDTTLGQPRFYSGLLLAFAAAATFLSCLGLYGLLTVTVTARRRELSVRVALGASPSSIVSLVLKNGATIVLGGVAVGLALSTVAVRLLRSFLHGVDALDAPTFTAAAATLCVLSMLAALAPARRAASTSVSESLRRGD